MASDQRPNPVPLLLRGLSQRLLMVLVGSFRFGLVAGKGMTLQVFLASLYKSFPAEVAPFFSETEQLEKLVRELSSIDLSAHEIAPATNPGDPGRMLISKMDERLVGGTCILVSLLPSRIITASSAIFQKNPKLTRTALFVLGSMTILFVLTYR